MRAGLLIAFLVLATACGSTGFRHSDGFTVSERHGRLFVGDVPLDHKREVVLEGELGGLQEFVLATAGGPLEISGAPGSGYRLVVELYSEFENDGDVELDDGRIVAIAGRGRSLVHAIRGSVPERVSLDLASGTGSMSVRTLVGENHVAVDSGTGSLRLAECDVASISVDTGTGDVTVEGCTVGELRLSSGTAEVVAIESSVNMLEVSSGTGNVRLRRCKIEDLDVTSGTGDLLLIDTAVTSLRSMLGTGEIVSKISED